MTRAHLAQLIAERKSKKREREPAWTGDALMAAQARVVELEAKLTREENEHATTAMLMNKAEDESVSLLSHLADMKRERDESRRELCESHAVFYVDEAERGAATRAKAKRRGWAYLYPEEPSR